MFKKLEITNVGRLKSAKTDGDEEYFKKNTYIYGKNTFGKSTLTAIFRSLKENRVDYIVGRKTIGTQKQAVKITPYTTTPVGEYRYTTDEGKWSTDYKDIIVFDNHFVRESVYTQNQQIGQDEQKNIEAFMLGTKGVEYNKKITDLVDKISENTRTQTSTNLEYSRNKHLLGGLTFETFLDLKVDSDVDKKIKKVEKELDKVKNFELISSKLGDMKTLLEEYRDFETASLSEKLSVNSDLIAQHFTDHVNQKETKQTYSSFLQTGSRLRTRTKNEHCPFCTQEIKVDSVKEFLSTIDLIYNENYRNLQQSIREAEDLFPKENFSTKVKKIKKDLLQAGYELEIDFSDMDDLFDACEKSISAKKEDLSNDFNNIPFSSLSKKSVDHIASIDTELANFKNPAEKRVELESSLKELQANKERFGSWKEKSENYLKAKKENEKFGVEKTTLWDEYLAYANSLSTTMLGDINTVLGACNCSFKVKTFNFKGNQRQDLLVLSMDGNQISNDGDDHEMTVKNSLSDSDKWVLALAFFLTTVKNDQTIKVVVMDDPVSSFDVDRKRIIMKEIKRVLSGTDKQLILLTHELGFYHLLHTESMGDTSSVFLRILYDVTKGSDLIVCNPNEESEFMSEFNCWISNMKNANTSQDLSFVKTAHAGIRRVIEHILKAKYPLELTKECNTVGDMLTKLEQTGAPYAIASRRTDIDTILTNLPHHDNSGTGQYPVSHLGVEDYKKDIRDAFQLIKTL